MMIVDVFLMIIKGLGVMVLKAMDNLHNIR